MRVLAIDTALAACAAAESPVLHLILTDNKSARRFPPPWSVEERVASGSAYKRL